LRYVFAVWMLLLCTMIPVHPATAEEAMETRMLNVPPEAWKVSWTGDISEVDINVSPEGPLAVRAVGRPGSVHKACILSAPIPDGCMLTPESELRIVLSKVSVPFRIAAALETDQFYETPGRTLTSPSGETLVFDLNADDFKSASTGWAYHDRVIQEVPLTKLHVLLYPAAGKIRSMNIRRVVLTGVRPVPARMPRRIRALEIQQVVMPEKPIPQFGKMEADVFMSMAAENPFDPDQVTVDAQLLAPDGTSATCPGFLYAWADAAHPADHWKIRFSPSQTGAWQVVVQARTPDTGQVSAVYSFNCVESDRPGPLQVSTEDPRYFEHADGTFYYPIGHNVCWNSLRQYREQFARMQAAGENWSRIWLAPWNAEIEWGDHIGLYEGLDRYNLYHARKTDEIISLAEKHGIYLQLVLHEHCRVSAKTNPEWHNNPHNRARGGSCSEPAQFFTDAQARRHALKRLRYLVARYGYSGNLMAWELFNEVDLSDDFNKDADLAWHREMAEYIRQLDPHGHMITTSYISTPNGKVLRLPVIDYTQSHVYTEDLVSMFAYLYEVYRSLNKPHFVAEFGRHTDDGVDAEDTKGRILHAGIWSSFMLPEGGNAMSWWWYDLIDPNDLYRHFKALSRYAAGLDRRGRAWQWVSGKIETDCGRDVHLIGMAEPQACYAWVYDPDMVPWPKDEEALPRPFNAMLRVANLSAGKWTIEQWDTYSGEVLSRKNVTITNGPLFMKLVSRGPDTALKIYAKAGAHGTQKQMPALAMQAWNPAVRDAGRVDIEIPSSDEPVVIDGLLDEWSGFPAYELSRPAAAQSNDFALAFSVVHADGDRLYVAARVRDESLVRTRHPGPELWRDDCIELWIDALGDADYFNNMPHNPACWQINVAPVSKGHNAADHVIYRHPEYNNRTWDAIQAASRIHSNGYTVEISLPLDIMRQHRPATEHIRFNISGCDADTDGDIESWQHFLWQGKDEWDARQWSDAVLRSADGKQDKEDLNP
jgi:hypothetical protein